MFLRFLCRNEKTDCLAEIHLQKEGKLYNQSSGKCIAAIDEMNSLAKLEFCAKSPTFVLEEVQALS